jgi:hypothetical protein
VDNAVALVQAYLRVNGYFTVSEYPVLEARPHDHRTVTDLDILAFRFPRAGRVLTNPSRTRVGGLATALDPTLGADPAHGDMIVGEVKESRAVLNEATRKPEVLSTALVRFGCCPPEGAPTLVKTLIRRGRVMLPIGHEVRMVAFGAKKGSGAYHAVTLVHVVRFLQDYLNEHWATVRHAESKDPAFGLLILLEKALRAADPRSPRRRSGKP